MEEKRMMNEEFVDFFSFLVISLNLSLLVLFCFVTSINLMYFGGSSSP